MQVFSRYMLQSKVKKSLTKAGWEWSVQRVDKDHPQAGPLVMASGELKSQVDSVMQAKASAKFLAGEHGYEVDPVVIRPLPPAKK